MTLRDASFWRHGGPGTTVNSRVHVAGQFGAGWLMGNIQIVPHTLYAAPLILSAPVTIDGLFFDATVASGVTAQMALYAVECLSLPFPGRIVSQDSHAIGGPGGTMRATAANVGGSNWQASMSQDYAIGDQRLFWLAAAWTGSATVLAVSDPETWALLGYDATSLSAPFSHLVASWDAAVTLPNTFPAAWTECCTRLPALGLRVAG